MALLAITASSNSPNGGFNPPPVAHPAPPPPHPLHTPLVINITVVMKEVARDPAVVAQENHSGFNILHWYFSKYQM